MSLIKRGLFLIAVLLIPANLFAYDPTAGQVKTNTSAFDHNLSSADDTVQKALNTLDEVTGTGGSMVYPGAGIPLSTGSAWGTSITDNSANWNTAYGWGNHASAGYLTAETDPSALKTAGTDNVKDTHIDWGTGASQVSTDDITEGVTNLFHTGARAIASLLTGFTSGAGTVSATDSVLQAIQKLDGNVAAKQAADADLTDLADGELTASKVGGVKDADYGDVTVSSGAWAVEDDSHAHTSASISGLADADMGDNALDPDKLVGDTIDDDKVDAGLIPILNQNTSGTAANLSGTPALPNGTTATTQSQADNSTKLATTAYVDTGLGTKQATVTEGSLADSTIVSADIKDGEVTYADMVAMIPGYPSIWRISIVNPNAVVTASTIIPIGTVPANMTVTKVEAYTSSASYEVAGDLKYADARIGLANAVVVNDFDTSSGVRSDTSITSAAVAANKFVYLSFDSAPNASMTDCVIMVTFDYD